MPNNIIEKINIGDTRYDIQDVTSGYSQIEINNLLQQGVIIGTVILDGNNYIIYAPNDSSDAGGLDVSYAGINLNLTNT